MIAGTITVTVNAENHLEAINGFGLKEPGALISVNSVTEPIIRYQANSNGEIIELEHYGILE